MINNINDSTQSNELVSISQHSKKITKDNKGEMIGKIKHTR